MLGSISKHSGQLAGSSSCLCSEVLAAKGCWAHHIDLWDTDSGTPPGAVWEGASSHGSGTCQGQSSCIRQHPGMFLDTVSPTSLALPSHIHVLALRRTKVCALYGRFRLQSTEMLRQQGLNGCTSKLRIFTGLSLNVGTDFRSGCKSSDYCMFFCLIP